MVLVECPVQHQFDFEPGLGEIETPLDIEMVVRPDQAPPKKKYYITCPGKKQDGTDCGIEFMVEI